MNTVAASPAPRQLDPRQADLDATAFGDDGNATAVLNGIRWMVDCHDLAAIDDVLEFEHCFPGRAPTHEEAAKVLGEAMARPCRDALRQKFQAAACDGMQTWNEDQLEERAEAAEGRRGY